MGKRYCSGQEATEFVLISILVFFSALLVVFIFGNKIADFFSNQSSAVSVTKSGSRAVDPATGQKYENPPEIYSGPTNVTGGDGTNNTSKDYSNLNVTTNADGSMSMAVGNQTVTIDSQVQNLADAIYSNSVQTTGSSGKMEIMSEIAKMIETYKSEFPEGQVPIQLSFGTSETQYSYEEDGDGDDEREISKTINGLAAASSVTLMVGNHIVILQNDQCKADDSSCQRYQASRRIEATLRSDGKVQGTVTVTDGNSTGQKSFTSYSQTVNNNVLNQLCFTTSDPLRDDDDEPKTRMVLNFNQNFGL